MTRYRNHVASLFAMTCGLLAAAPAQAASLQSVATSAWSKGDVPTYISMYIYVPDKVATNPPILVVAHYCGGSASGVFGEAQSGGIVSASDSDGFIMIYPQTTNPATSADCWDVGLTKSLTHNGGGDTQAIAEMVSYTVTQYSANANRVYATGTSSGAMMTEALLAVYPDVFKAGAEFSGVPAGCWSDGWSAASNWGGTCASGGDVQTAQAWGNLVRAMYPGYTGYRPRIQLWHGSADTTISPTNQTEAIKEWTNVLGLSTDPTTTTTVSFNNHSWTRQSWQDSCGYTVLDAWLEANGPHGTDANLNSTYVIPFLALDKSGATDPKCAVQRAAPPELAERQVPAERRARAARLPLEVPKRAVLPAQVVLTQQLAVSLAQQATARSAAKLAPAASLQAGAAMRQLAETLALVAAWPRAVR